MAVSLLFSAVLLVRLGMIVPDWINGTDPARSEHYLQRSLTTATMLGTVGVSVQALTASPDGPSRRRRRLMGTLLVVSIATLVVSVVRDVAQNRVAASSRRFTLSLTP